MRLKKQIPNTLSCSRILLAILVFLTIIEENFGLSLFLFLLALLTDAFDGFLARRWQVVSFIGGEILETLGDGLLIFLSILAFVIIGVLPLWFFLGICLGALIFLTYTRQSKSRLVKDITIIVQYLGYSTFVTSVILYLSHLLSDITIIPVLVFLALGLYFKRDRYYVVLEHLQKVFIKSRQEKRV